MFLRYLLKDNNKIIINLLNNININNKRNAGHSKWANIRHIKSLKDGQKSLQFKKLSRQIRLAIEDGKTSNPLLNQQLQSAIDDALKKNMPNQTIQQILKKTNNNNLIQKKYILEINFHNKIAIICIIYTDNINKIKIDLGTLLKKSGASLGEVRHLFDETGLLECIAPDIATIGINGNPVSIVKTSTTNITTKKLTVSCENLNLEDVCTEHAIDCGAETINIIDLEKRLISITCDPLHIESVKKCLIKHKYCIEFAEHIFIPKHPITLNTIEEKAYNIFYEKLKLYDVIEEIYDNVI